MMDDLLDKIKDLLSSITELQDVYIGEVEGDIPAAIVDYAIVDEGNPTEGFDYSGTMVRNTLTVDVKVFTIVANAFVESSIKRAIELSKLVQNKISENPTLGGLCKASRLTSIDSVVGQIGGGEQKYLRGRVLTYQITRVGVINP